MSIQNNKVTGNIFPVFFIGTYINTGQRSFFELVQRPGKITAVILSYTIQT